MSGVRVLVGTRKGAFILTSDEKRQNWAVSGPHFAGWEIYHMKGSRLNPNRIYASLSGGWFGQLMHRSDVGGRNRGHLVGRELVAAPEFRALPFCDRTPSLRSLNQHGALCLRKRLRKLKNGIRRTVRGVDAVAQAMQLCPFCI